MRKKTIDEFFEMLFELTGYFWQVGAVVTILSLFATYKSLMLALAKNAEAHASTVVLSIFLDKTGWIWYVFPVIFGAISVIFAIKTYSVLVKQAQY